MTVMEQRPLGGLDLLEEWLAWREDVLAESDR